MNKKTSLKIILVLIVLVVAGVGLFFRLLPKWNPDTSVTTSYDPLFGWKFPVSKFMPNKGTGKNLFDFEIAFSNVRDPGGIPSGLPIRLKVPIIGVDSAIEDALITPDGRMDVPAGSVNVAWFALGPNPGQEGSAVIGGHFGIRNGVPFVFYNLDKLKIGDKIYIEDDKGDTLAFQVRTIKLFDRNADATTVFTSDDGKAHLNLITCEGIWNQVNGAYPSRRVVFTDAIPSEGPIKVNPLFPTTAIPPSSPAPAPIPPAAPVPSPVLTPSAIPTPTPTPIITNIPIPTPTPNIVTTIPATPTPATKTADTPVQTLKSLFATPVDGLVTTILLFAIFFVLFKIIML